MNDADTPAVGGESPTLAPNSLPAPLAPAPRPGQVPWDEGSASRNDHQDAAATDVDDVRREVELLIRLHGLLRALRDRVVKPSA